ncbi:hypothetical protein QCA50_006636 [Cerrena zonata]|uniref:Uncharacterized protein n=1 Tax=Cerrena zonata TaxID=2478898 RepID=A0AAW0GK18_9APHY
MGVYIIYSLPSTTGVDDNRRVDSNTSFSCNDHAVVHGEQKCSWKKSTTDSLPDINTPRKVGILFPNVSESGGIPSLVATFIPALGNFESPASSNSPKSKTTDSKRHLLRIGSCVREKWGKVWEVGPRRDGLIKPALNIPSIHTTEMSSSSVTSLYTNKPVIKADLPGKTVMVMGANTGIGYETAKHLATMQPSKVIITARNEEKAAATVSNLQKDTGFQNIEGRVVELTKFASVLEFVDKFNKDGDDLDILIVNAGVIAAQFIQTQDGWEETVQINHLSNSLVSLLLLPRLAESAKKHSSLSRLVIVSSGVHEWVDLAAQKTGPNVLEYLNTPASFEDKRYPTTKLLNMLFTRALAAHLEPTSNIIVNTVTPGLCRSDLARNLPPNPRLEAQLPLARSSEEGSRQLIWAAIGPENATAEEAKKLHGQYVHNTEIKQPSEWTISDEGKVVQEKVWNETVEILSKVSPSLKDVIKTLVL